MNNLINFNFDNRKVRTILINDKPYFLGCDVAEALGYINTRDAISRHCKGVVKHDIGVETGRKADGTLAIQKIGMIFISEGDVFRLIIKSRLKKAQKFESLVMDEILPTLRKTGFYSIQPKNDILRYAINLCETKIGRKIHVSVIEFLKNHEYYRDGKVYNSCHMYDNFESWFLSSCSHNDKCINYFQFISSMRNMGFIKGQAPLGWDVLVYREIIKTREDIKLDNRQLKYFDHCNKINKIIEYYNIEDGWLENIDDIK